MNQVLLEKGMYQITDSIKYLQSNNIMEIVKRSTAQQLQLLQMPDAAVALAQAATKVNGEPEKYLSGLPMLFPCKVQMINCEKCSREFCSAINFRRHSREHRRSLNTDKDFLKTRELLGAYWDKLPLDVMKEIVSFKSVALEGVSGVSVIKALASLIQRPGFPLLPQVYLNAGAALLDVIEGMPLSFPLSSQELFGMLDDASERTFLRFGNAMTLQKYLFSGESGSIAIDPRNVVACTSFILEQELVKAWLAHKDVEALKCQQRLMEEEEAAQKRLAELLERRRMKKLRQRQKRCKELLETDSRTGIKASIPDYVDLAATSSIVESGGGRPPNYCLEGKKVSINQGISTNSYGLFKLQRDCDDNNLTSNMIADHDSDQQIDKESGKVKADVVGHKIPNTNSCLDLATQSPHIIDNGQSYSGLKLRFGAEDSANGRNIEHADSEATGDAPQKYEVMIGSINIKLGNYFSSNKDGISCRQELFEDMWAENELDLRTVNQTTMKSWRPKEFTSANNFNFCSEKMDGQNFYKSADQNPISKNSLFADRPDNKVAEKCNEILTLAESAVLPVPGSFSSRCAKEVLEQRWKETAATDHVTLILTSAESSKYPEAPVGNCVDSQITTLFKDPVG